MRQSAIYLFDRTASTAAAISAIARMGARNRGRSVLHSCDRASQISARLLRGSIVNFYGIPRADNTRNTGGRQMRDRRCSPELLTTRTTRLETRNKREHLDYRPLEENRPSNAPPFVLLRANRALYSSAWSILVIRDSNFQQKDESTIQYSIIII